MTELTQIANRHNTDKGTFDLYSAYYPDKENKPRLRHGYTEFYDQYFREYKGKCPVILEIGVQNGGSIRTMLEYFNENCIIHCIDCNPKCLDSVISLKHNVYFHLLDQSDEESLKNFVENLRDVKFDFIIDDGSHMVHDQMLTYKYLRNLVKKSGFYIIEDAHTSYAGDFNGGWHGVSNETLPFFTEFRPSSFFSKEENLEMMKEIKSVTTFNSANMFDYDAYNNMNYMSNPDTVKFSRAITILVKYE